MLHLLGQILGQVLHLLRNDKGGISLEHGVWPGSYQDNGAAAQTYQNGQVALALARAGGRLVALVLGLELAAVLLEGLEVLAAGCGLLRILDERFEMVQCGRARLRPDLMSWGGGEGNFGA